MCNGRNSYTLSLAFGWWWDLVPLQTSRCRGVCGGSGCIHAIAARGDVERCRHREKKSTSREQAHNQRTDGSMIIRHRHGRIFNTRNRKQKRNDSLCDRRMQTLGGSLFTTTRPFFFCFHFLHTHANMPPPPPPTHTKRSVRELHVTAAPRLLDRLNLQSEIVKDMGGREYR
jgi:hypothetical protein